MIDTSNPNPVAIDHDAALTLLAELRVGEQSAPYTALKTFLLQNNIWIPAQLVIKKAKEIARERGVALRAYKGEFKSDLAHALLPIQYLN